MTKWVIREIEVSAPSRIHCGLFSVGGDLPINFGGCGFMVRQPRTRIRICSHRNLRISGADPAWVCKLLGRWGRALGGPWVKSMSPKRYGNSIKDWPLSIEVLQSPPRHCGLGSGTQMALAIASGMQHATGQPEKSISDLAIAMNRGGRSAIGSYGFALGGFLVDRGLSKSDRISPLEMRAEMPLSWRVVLVSPNVEAETGIYGRSERTAFERLIPSTQRERVAMIRCLRSEVVPALRAADYPAFGESIYRFGKLSGRYFLPAQGGHYHSPTLTRLVNQIRDWGISAVVQSSWGPCLAAIAPHDIAAQELVDWLPDDFAGLITECDTRGALMQTESKTLMAIQG